MAPTSFTPVSNKTIVFYHGHCPDGCAAVLALLLHYREVRPEHKIRLVRSYVSKKDITSRQVCGMIGENDVIYLDFTHSEEIMQAVQHRVQWKKRSFLVIDHHISSERSLSCIKDEYKIFDTSRSAAGIAWEFFHPGKPMPDLYRLIQEYDIYRLQDPRTLPLATLLWDSGRDPADYEPLLEEENLDEAVKQGRVLLASLQHHVQELYHRSSWLAEIRTSDKRLGGVPQHDDMSSDKRLGGVRQHDDMSSDSVWHRVLMVNSRYLVNEVGKDLLEENESISFCCIYSWNELGTYYSLRSQDSSVDLSAIAEKYGGGGHAGASGFRLPGSDPYFGCEHRFLRKIEAPLPVPVEHGEIANKRRLKKIEKSLSGVRIVPVELDGKWLRVVAVNTSTLVDETYETVKKLIPDIELLLITYFDGEEHHRTLFPPMDLSVDQLQHLVTATGPFRLDLAPESSALRTIEHLLNVKKSRHQALCEEVGESAPALRRTLCEEVGESAPVLSPTRAVEYILYNSGPFDLNDLNHPAACLLEQRVSSTDSSKPLIWAFVDSKTSPSGKIYTFYNPQIRKKIDSFELEKKIKLEWYGQLPIKMIV